MIVTPFAQILASLRNVRTNLVSIANIPADENRPRPIPRRPPLHSTALPEDVVQYAQDTLDELDWCLDQLETIQTHRSVSDMAFNKVFFFEVNCFDFCNISKISFFYQIFESSVFQFIVHFFDMKKKKKCTLFWVY